MFKPVAFVDLYLVGCLGVTSVLFCNNWAAPKKRFHIKTFLDARINNINVKK